MMKTKNAVKLAVCCAAVMSAAALFAPVSAYAFVSYGEYQTVINRVSTPLIYNNITINGVDVSGLSKADAAAKLNDQIGGKLLGNSVTVNSGQASASLTLKQLGVSYDFAKPVEDAFSYARTGNIYQRFVQISNLKNAPYNVRADITPVIDRDAAAKALASFADKVNVPAADATMELTASGISIKDGAPGVAVDIGKTIDAIAQNLSTGQSFSVDAVMGVAHPRVTAADLKGSTDLLGTFTTHFTTGSDQYNRNQNIKTAALKVSGTIMMPGDVFSCNRALGDMTSANGYYLAHVIEDGRLTEGMGGGVCQVSTTLYNAVLKAELNVTERTNHSLKVGYIDYSFDSTLAGDYIDLKFKNSTNSPVYLYMNYNPGGSLTASVYGHETRPANRTIKFANKFIGSTPAPKAKITQDNSLQPGQTVVDQAGKDGLTYQLIKTVYIDGKPTDSVVVNKSYYKAVQLIERTGPPAPETPAPDGTPAQPPADNTAPAQPPGDNPAPPPSPSPSAAPDEPISIDQQMAEQAAAQAAAAAAPQQPAPSAGQNAQPPAAD